MDLETKLKEYVAEHKEEIKKKYDAVDVCVGYKVSDGERSRDPCVRVFVKEKGVFKNQKEVPNVIGDFMSDVEEEVEYDALALTGEYRPLVDGCSIGNIKITAGTLGFPYKKYGKFYWLSNAHVLSEDPFKYISDQETVGVQQGVAHGGSKKIGDMRYMVLLNNINNPEDMALAKSRVAGEQEDGTVFQAQGMNSVDAALELPDDQEQVAGGSLIEGYGVPDYAETIAKLGDHVEYITWQVDGLAKGQVTDLGKTVIVNYGGNKQAKIIDCILTTKMSGPGSSGSGAMVRRSGKTYAIGLNFAGSSNQNVICGIQHINIAFGGEVATTSDFLEEPVEPPVNEEGVEVNFELNEEDGTYRVYGIVRKANADILPDATITLNDVAVNSDANGRYEFLEIPIGEYRIVASKQGYISQAKGVSVGDMPTSEEISINKSFWDKFK